MKKSDSTNTLNLPVLSFRKTDDERNAHVPCEYVFVITMQDEGEGLYVEGVYSTDELARERLEVLKDKNPSYYICSQRFEVERKLP